MAMLVLRSPRTAPVNTRVRLTKSVRGPSGAEHDTSRPAPFKVPSNFTDHP
jgi:hypothetical protein